MLPEILSHVQSKQHFTRCFFKVWKLQKRAEQFMELFNLFELEILGYYLRVFRSSREFLLPPLIYLSSFVWALTTASQAKLFRFAFQHLFGRTKFSVTYNGQGVAFVL